MVAGETFSGPVPPPYLPDVLQGGLGFQGQLEQFGPANLTAVFALKVTGRTYMSNNHPRLKALTVYRNKSFSFHIRGWRHRSSSLHSRRRLIRRPDTKCVIGRTAGVDPSSRRRQLHVESFQLLATIHKPAGVPWRSQCDDNYWKWLLDSRPFQLCRSSQGH